ncbi:hypothetical protein B0H14DRAFT_2972635 [Mycena olivaceomarginata]|nr:hypothetical protein B0H14DRAFT_2972635 [Mycena olivaceomarginata]
MPSPRMSTGTAVLGGLDLAISAAVFLQGVLCAQFAHYTNVNTRDGLWLKLFVTGLALLTTLKTVQVLGVMWMQNVTLFEDSGAVFRLWATHWVPKLSPILEALIAVYVQGFFCRRLRTISGNVYIVILCMIAFAFALVSGIVAVFFTFTKMSSPQYSTWMSIHLGAALCADLLLTGKYCVLLAGRSSLCARFCPLTPISSDIRKPNILLTMGPKSAAPAALCAFINFVAVVLLNGRTAIPVSATMGGGSNTVLPQLYAWSAMWTLNSREDINLAADNSRYTLHPELQGTSDSETPDYNDHGRTDKPMMGLRSGQDRLTSLGVAQKLPRNSELVCTV